MQWRRDKNKVRFALELPIKNQPGHKFNYNSPATHLLSVILAKTGGMSLVDFADTHLFAPMGIKKRKWEIDANGNALGASGISLRSRDLAKFGFLYLNNGFWGGKQIIPTEWVMTSTRQQSTGGSPEQEAYGYLWWVTTLTGHPAYFAGGYGGQYIYIIPNLDLVVVITSELDRPHRENRKIISDFIVPSISK